MNDDRIEDLAAFHWQLEMLQSIDTGLVVLDRDYRIKLWNGFMENHSGYRPSDVRDKPILELFKDIPADWFERKCEAVFKLNNRAFTTWEQRPYVFKFRNYRPLTGISPYMYQNMTIIPLPSTSCTVDHICLIIYDVTDVAANREQLRLVNEDLQSLSRIDKLTGLYNRGYWEEQLIQEFSRFQRTKVVSTLVMFDIDHFKQVNDTYGHQAGDEVIRMVSKCVQKTARETDISGRYGGEEFCVILVNTDLTQAQYFAERLRKNIEKESVEFGGVEIKITISLGVAQAHDSLPDHEAWLQHSDQALYMSKEGGRNKVTLTESTL